MKVNPLVKQALESFKDDVAEGISVSELDQFEDSDASDMSAAQSELSAISDEGDTFGTALESLVKIYSAMEDFAGKGFGSEAANFADIAIRSAVKPTKMEAPMIAACEAFDRRPAIALSLSQETLGSYIAELWEKIKKFFSNIWEMVKKFGELVFSANARLRNYAQKIEDRARAAGGSPKAASIKLSQKQAQAICDKNGVQNHRKLIDLKDFESASQSCLRVSAEAHKALGVNAHCLQQMFKTGDAKNVAGFVNEVAKNGVGIPEFFSHHANEDGKAVYYSDTLPGSIRFKLILKEKVDASTGVFDAVWHAAQLSSYRITTELVPTNISAFVMYPTMKLDDVAHCAANAIKMTEAVDEVARKAKEMDSRTADIIKGYSHNPREDMNATDRAATSAVARQLMRIESMRYELMMHVVKGMSGYVRAALNVCNLSLQQYEKDAIVGEVPREQAAA